MNFGKFDYFRRLEKPSLILSSPNKEQIAVLNNIADATVICRFNDFSEIEFSVTPTVTNSRGKKIKLSYYDKLQTQRLLFLDGFGYFVIQEVVEENDGITNKKIVRADSLQARFKNFGFYQENRIYKFYDPEDEKDANYDSDDIEAIPSVVGELCKQLGIEVDYRVKQGLGEIATTEFYDEWTITYIDPVLYYKESNENNIFRSFTESKTISAYDFIVNGVEETFEIVVLFDFLHQAIQIKTVENITAEKTNIYLSYDNVVTELHTTESSNEITTILNCNGGNNLTIESVNPTGNNYIADFSYFMYRDSSESEPDGNKGWMSSALTDKIKSWENDVEGKRTEWSDLVLELRGSYNDRTILEEKRQFIQLKLDSMRAAVDTHFEESEEPTGLEITLVEQVLTGENSLDENSLFYFGEDNFNSEAEFVCYKVQPAFVETTAQEADVRTGYFAFSGEQMTDTLENCRAAGYLYFADGSLYDSQVGAHTSYCLLTQKTEVVDKDSDNPQEVISVGGFERYTIYSNVPEWISLLEMRLSGISSAINTIEGAINDVVDEMNDVSESLNLQNRFNLNDSEDLKLFRELKAYWIEGDYENQGLTIYDTTMPEEQIDLANELLEAGKRQLARLSQPRFSIGVSAIDFTKIYAFKAFAEELELGKIITIQKAEDTHYYPMLTSIRFNLNDPEDFELEFSNKLKPDDWGFTWGDLAKQGAEASRNISQNIQEYMSFTNNRKNIEQLLFDPLNRTLRLAQSNMSKQDFVVDNTGIIGRRFADDSKSSFEPEQVRLINNIMLFTDDGWQTAKTAFGRIIVPDPNDTDKYTMAYGLLAEAIVGSLIVGNTLYITNESNTISLDEKGITIKNATTGDIVFHAGSDGSLTVKNYAKTEAVEELADKVADIEGNISDLKGRVTTAEAGINLNADNIAANFSVYTKFTTEEYASFKYDATRAVINLDDRLVYTEDELGKLTTRVTAAESGIVTNANDIEANAGLFARFKTDDYTVFKNITEEDLNGLTERVEGAEDTLELLTVRANTAESNINLNANDIAAQASLFSTFKTEEYNPFVDNTTQTLFEASATISTMAQRVDDLGGTVSAVDIRVSAAEQGLNEVEASLTLKISKDDLLGTFTSQLNATADTVIFNTDKLIIQNGNAAGWKILSDRLVSTNDVVGMCSSTTGGALSFWAGGSGYVARFTASLVLEDVPFLEKPLRLVINAPLLRAKTFAIRYMNEGLLQVVNITVNEGETTADVAFGRSISNVFFLETGMNTMQFTQQHEGNVPAFSVTNEGFLTATKGEIANLTLEAVEEGSGYRLRSDNFSLQTADESTGINSQLTFFKSWDTRNNPTTIVSSDMIKTPLVRSEAVLAESISIENWLDVAGASVQLGNGSVYGMGQRTRLWMNMGNSTASYTASAVAVATNRIRVTVSQYLLEPKTFKVQYKVVGGNWHTMDIHISTTSLYEEGVTVIALLGISNVSILNGDTSFVQSSTGENIGVVGNLLPASNNSYNLGEQGKSWKDIYGTYSSGSDRDIKNDIREIDDKYTILFDKLIPVTYVLKNGTSGRTHIGFDANQIEEALSEVGIPTQEFAAYCCKTDASGNTIAGTRTLRYDEFIAMNMREIQNLKKKISILEKTIN